MSLDDFDDVLSEVSQYTNEIACHVMGDPLTLSNLNLYLDIIQKHGLKALLTTSGYFLKKQSMQTLLHPAVKQINISLNSYNKNDTSLTLEQYLDPIFRLCSAKDQLSPDTFINLRIWNLDELMSEKEFNSTLFEKISETFQIDLDLQTVYVDRPKSIRLEYKTLLHFDSYFQWPSLANTKQTHGTCLGLDSHIAILASGDVVPCCLDGDGIMGLGNIFDTSLSDILDSDRATSIIDGFKNNHCAEELCRKCTYKNRFNDIS